MSTSPSVDFGNAPLSAFLRRMERFLGLIAAFALIALMALTCVDVLGRYLFNLPLPGGFELTELGMGALIFTALPLVTLHRQHVRVDLIEIFPVRWRAFQHAILDLLAALCMGIISWRLWIKAEDMWRAGETTATLHIPVYPLVYYMALLAFVTSVLIVLFAWDDAFGNHPAPKVVS